MTRLFVYLFLMGLILYFFSKMRRQQVIPSKETTTPKPGKWFKPKRNPLEPWVQIYETSSMDEARVLQARLQEEDLECILYEQGKKDIHGNAPKGVGLAVPKATMSMAQTIVSRLLS